MNKTNALLGIDIGGSHISVALVNTADGKLLQDTYLKKSIDPREKAEKIIGDWMDAIHTCLSRTPVSLKAVGVAIPGPFDYEKGISLIAGVNKYESLYGINIKASLQSQLTPSTTPVFFENDAVCFGVGECLSGLGAGYRKVMAITLGTGLGAAFIEQHEPRRTGPGVPPEGHLYNIPFKEGMAEDYISARWLLQQVNERTGGRYTDVKEIADLAMHQDNREQDKEDAKAIFKMFGHHIGLFLSSRIRDYGADCLVLGGGIIRSASLFLPAIEEVFAANNILIPVKSSQASELSAIAGAAGMALKKIS